MLLIRPSTWSKRWTATSCGLGTGRAACGCSTTQAASDETSTQQPRARMRRCMEGSPYLGGLFCSIRGSNGRQAACDDVGMHVCVTVGCGFPVARSRDATGGEVETEGEIRLSA